MKNFKFGASSALKKLAKHSFAKHSFLKEWRVFILITLVVKIAAMIFSIFAGYFYFNNLFTTILNSPFAAKIFAITNLLLIEVLTAIILSKFFKFVIKGQIKTAIPILLLTVGFFSISFYSSTNGLALRQSKKVDNIEIINASYQLKKENLNLNINQQKDLINDQIVTIKNNPQGWNKGKRTILLSDQLLSIDLYYKDLKRLEKAKRNDLRKIKESYLQEKAINNAHMTNEADKFYNIVTIIMVLIFLVNGLLMFFYSKIFDENEKELSKIEVIDDFSTEVEQKTVQVVETKILDTMNMYFEAFTKHVPTAELKKALDKESITIPVNDNSKKTIGFEQLKEKKPLQNESNVKQNDNMHATRSTKISVCKNCGSEFEKNTPHHKFCNESCRVDFWESKNNKKAIPHLRKK